MSWVSRELDDMPTIVDVATKMEKVIAFLVEAGYTYEKLMYFKPTKEDQIDRDRRVRMQLVNRNFLQRALKGAYPNMESYSYFRGANEHGGKCLGIPALGVILATRLNRRPMEASICATQSGVTLNASLRSRMEYSIAYAKEREKRGDKSGSARLMPSLSTERDSARSATGELSQFALDKAAADLSASQAAGSASSRRAQTTSSSRPSTEAEPKAKKPRRQNG